MQYTQRKTNYVWGAPRTDAAARQGNFDCSSFTQHVFRQHGINLGANTQEQVKQGQQVSRNNMRPGDLIFFNTNRTNGHVGIYVGNGEWVGAQSSNGVQRVKMNNSSWSSKFSQVRRVL